MEKIMNIQMMIDNLNSDLMNEYKHMHFYLHSAIVITGLHREELKEFLTEEAQGEMEHVQQFGNLILGLGGVPTTDVAPFPTNLTLPVDILAYALQMEEEVAANYVKRMEAAAFLGGVDGKWIEIFLEDQLMKSRKDVDHLRQLLNPGA
jgi:bacterioferritin (cytochrome b1)